MTQQIETVTVAGTITTGGNATFTVTAAGMTGSPKAVTVPVLLNYTAAETAQAARYALATDADVSALFLVGGSSANVTLTRRIDAANDTTLNIAVDNDTCDGLTPVTTSANTLAGVPVDVYYIALADFKYYRKIPASSTIDDEKILSMIAAAQSYIERRTGQVFRCDEDTERAFYDEDLEGNTLCFDKPIASITSITNGNGETIDAANFIFEPRDGPYNRVRLKPSSGLFWYVGLDEITVTGRWAYMVTPSGDIKEAMLEIVNFLYEKSSSPTDSDRQIITPEGIILPAGISKTVSGLIEVYKNRV